MATLACRAVRRVQRVQVICMCRIEPHLEAQRLAVVGQVLLGTRDRPVLDAVVIEHDDPCIR